MALYSVRADIALSLYLRSVCIERYPGRVRRSSPLISPGLLVLRAIAKP